MAMSDDADISSVSTIAIYSNISFKGPATPKRSDARKKLKTRRKTKHCSVALKMPRNFPKCRSSCDLTLGQPMAVQLFTDPSFDWISAKHRLSFSDWKHALVSIWMDQFFVCFSSAKAIA